MSHNSDSSSAGAVRVAVPTQRPSSKPCRLCGDDIPQKRLTATEGKATECVPCLELIGDVPRIKRFDESGADGEVVETVFFKNSYIEDQMDRVNSIAAPDEAFEIAVGDDSFLQRDNSQPIAQGFSPTEAFESEEVVEVLPVRKTDTQLNKTKKRSEYDEDLGTAMPPPTSGMEYHKTV